MTDRSDLPRDELESICREYERALRVAIDALRPFASPHFADEKVLMRAVDVGEACSVVESYPFFQVIQKEDRARI